MHNGSNGSSRPPRSERLKTILICDDRPNALAAIELLLEAHGFNVVKSHDVASGLAALDEWAIDAIVADLRLGDGKPDGAVLLASAREWHRGIRARFLLTSDSLGAQHAFDTESVWIDRGEDDWADTMVGLLKEATGRA